MLTACDHFICGACVRAPVFLRLGCAWSSCSVGQGVLPDINTYNAALSVISRSGREDVALALLNQMRIDGETVARVGVRIFSSERTIAAVAAASFLHSLHTWFRSKLETTVVP